MANSRWEKSGHFGHSQFLRTVGDITRPFPRKVSSTLIYGRHARATTPDPHQIASRLTPLRKELEPQGLTPNELYFSLVFIGHHPEEHFQPLFLPSRAPLLEPESTPCFQRATPLRGCLSPHPTSAFHPFPATNLHTASASSACQPGLLAQPPLPQQLAY